MTALLRSSLPLVGSGHKHAAQRPQVPRLKRAQGGEQLLSICRVPTLNVLQVSQQQNRRALKAPASSSGAETEAEAVQPATEARPALGAHQNSGSDEEQLQLLADSWQHPALLLPGACIPPTAAVRAQGLKQDLTAALTDLEALDAQLAQGHTAAGCRADQGSDGEARAWPLCGSSA